MIDSIYSTQDLPRELRDHIWEYVPYTVTRTVCRKTHEMRLAEGRVPTGCAHAMHIAIQRFHWRWVAIPMHRTLGHRSIALAHNGHAYDREDASDDVMYLSGTRETYFCEDTLRFHTKWTGPPVPYDAYYLGQIRMPAGVYVGGN